MYYPVLRGKQNELLSIREIVEKLGRNNLIIPIIEPVKNSERSIADLNRCLESLDSNDLEAVLIVNPRCGGDFDNNKRAIEQIIQTTKQAYNKISYGLWIGSETSSFELNSFIANIDAPFYLLHHSQYENLDELHALLDGNSNFKKNILDVNNLSRSYISSFSDNKVKLTDNFNKQSPNGEYRGILNEFFSDTYLNYESEGFDGFSDYSIVGADYTDGGFTPNTVVFHLVYEAQHLNGIWIRHFLSETYRTNQDIGMMIIEALQELQGFLAMHPQILEYSTACVELMRILDEARTTSLGNLKKLGIKHHLELMIDVLSIDVENISEAS